jgi:hypothetical protein
MAIMNAYLIGLHIILIYKGIQIIFLDFFKKKKKLIIFIFFFKGMTTY